MIVRLQRFFKIDTNPNLSDRIRFLQKNASRKARTKQLMSTLSYRTSSHRRHESRFKRSGYAFSHEKGFGDLITSGKNMPGGKESGSIRLWSRNNRMRPEIQTGTTRLPFIIEVNGKNGQIMEELPSAVMGDAVDGVFPNGTLRTTAF